MPVLFPNVRGHLETKSARDTARQESAKLVMAEVRADQQAADERTAQLRAMRLAREKSAS